MENNKKLETITCECGMNVTKKNISTHRKKHLHKDRIQRLNKNLKEELFEILKMNGLKIIDEN